jgi:hypothetical protein
MKELIVRFLIGGTLVSCFALLAEVLRPKSLAGVFGAAPSIALATLGITIAHQGKVYAAVEARSMIFGSIAFFLYAAATGWILMKRKLPALTTTISLMPLWLGASLGLWRLFTR